MRTQIPQSSVGEESNDGFALVLRTLGELSGSVESRA